MLTVFQAVLLGALQGITELFPISSLGHTVLFPTLLGWHIDQASAYFLPFLVLTHLATALVLLAVFWKEWLLIIKGMINSLRSRTISSADTYARLGWLLVVASIPAGLLGVLFSEKLALLFSEPKTVALFLVGNGIVLLSAEVLRRKNERRAKKTDAHAANLPWRSAFIVGCAQCLALFPGFSRTGAALGGGLFVGLNHEEAARFSFLMATPLIFAAALLEVPALFLPASSVELVPAFAGAAAAAITAYFSIRFLLKYFQTKTLLPFAIYCMLAGSAFLLFI
jgi:undecaprenyl-diphosphatase